MQQQEQHHQQQPQQQHQQQHQHINFQPGSGPHPTITSNNLPNFPSTSGAPPQMRMQNLQMQPNPILQQAYLQFAMQQQQQAAQQQQQQHKSHASLLTPQQQQQQSNAATANALKVQELMSLQRNSNNSNSSSNHNPHMPRPTQPQPVNPTSGNPNPGPNHNSANQLAMLQQIQMMQAWAKEQNLDLSVPANMNLVAQMFPIWQNATRMAALQQQQQKNTGESSSATMQGQQQQSQQQQHQQMVMPSPGGSEGSASHGSNPNPLSEMSGQQHGGMLKPRKPVQPGVTSGDNLPGMVNNLLHERGARLPVTPLGQASNSANNSNTVSPSNAQESPGLKSAFMGPNSEQLQMQYMRQLQQQQQQNHQKQQQLQQQQQLQHQQQLLQQQQQHQVQLPPTASAGMPNPGPSNSSGEAGGRAGVGFTKSQLHVLKAQILAFRRLKVYIKAARFLEPFRYCS